MLQECSVINERWLGARGMNVVTLHINRGKKKVILKTISELFCWWLLTRKIWLREVF